MAKTQDKMKKPVEKVEKPQVLRLDKGRPYAHCFMERKPDWFEQDGKRFSVSEPHEELPAEELPAPVTLTEAINNAVSTVPKKQI